MIKETENSTRTKNKKQKNLSVFNFDIKSSNNSIESERRNKIQEDIYFEKDNEALKSLIDEVKIDNEPTEFYFKNNQSNKPISFKKLQKEFILDFPNFYDVDLLYIICFIIEKFPRMSKSKN
jgi:hypothetical protein